MGRIGQVKKVTDNPYLNLYEAEVTLRNGSTTSYYISSRSTDAAGLKAVSGHRRADGVIIYSVYGPRQDSLVLIRQYRYPLGDFVYEFPAGLVDPGEDVLQAGIREMREETGLEFTPRPGGVCSRPFFTTVGMTDESCAMVYGCCSGTPSSAGQEETEDIQVVLADRDECRRILREENVAVMAAYMMMHFIASEDDPLAFLEKVGGSGNA